MVQNQSIFSKAAMMEKKQIILVMFYPGKYTARIQFIFYLEKKTLTR